MKKIEKLLEVVTVILMAALVLIITLQIVSRMMNSPFIWTEELSRFALVYVTFLGAALAYYKGRDLRITMLIDRFPPSWRKINDTIIQIVNLILTAVLIYSSYHFAVEVWDTPLSALRWDKGLMLIVVPIGFALILIRQFRDLTKAILQN